MQPLSSRRSVHDHGSLAGTEPALSSFARILRRALVHLAALEGAWALLMYGFGAAGTPGDVIGALTIAIGVAIVLVGRAVEGGAA